VKVFSRVCVLFLSVAGLALAQSGPLETIPLPDSPGATLAVGGGESYASEGPRQSSTQQPANEQNASKPAQSSGDQTKDQKEKTQEQTTGTSNDRLFWTLPNFLTVKTKEIPPLTTGQKFKVVARGTFDPIEYVYIGFLAGISQASDSEPGFGQGAQGYAKRFGSAFADNAIENFFTGAIFPSLLKQDPRFYELGHGSFGRRTEYAISRIFITRSDSGKTQFNCSEICGSAISAGISTFSYHPREDRNVGNAFSVWGTQVGWDTVTIVVKEFWPDIHRKLSKKKNVPAATAVPSN
jgi:hypothetical protein